MQTELERLKARIALLGKPRNPRVHTAINHDPTFPADDLAAANLAHDRKYGFTLGEGMRGRHWIAGFHPVPPGMNREQLWTYYRKLDALNAST